MSKSAAELIAKAPWLSRRNFAKGLAGTGMLAAAGLPARHAAAKTTITWMGWQGYETPITSGTFLADNDIDFQPTFIGSNEEIITKLQAGGIGNTDLITMYFGYLLMARRTAGAGGWGAHQRLRRSHSAVHRAGCHQA
jgi:spermidine/putrescine transport system substrate-binding protein